jgi:uncharacterized protein YndB with AHSA1/START domain
MIDVIHQISTVHRQIGTRTLPAGEARTVIIARQYSAAVEDVWDAVTNPRRIPRWFTPISGELHVGGHYQLEGNASGTIERCDPPRSFTATWEYGGEVSWIELRLSAHPDGSTRLELEHIAHLTDERFAEFGPGAVGIGWDLGLLGLSLYLEADEALDPRAAAAWTVSEEGKQFMTLSSQRWCDASIAAGTDRAAAQAAAERTTAFYTAMDPQVSAAT